MAKVCRCDRCGAIYDKVYHEGLNKVEIRYTQLKEEGKAYTRPFTNLRDYDLCEECGSELSKWLSKRTEATNETV